MKSVVGFPVSASEVCDLTLLGVNVKPFPHVVHEQFIRPEHYRRLAESDPFCPRTAKPTRYSLFWGDEGYERLLEEQPTWRSLHETFHSQSFIDWAVEQFA